MSDSIECPSCGAQTEIMEENRGQEVLCSKCFEVVPVSAPEPPEAPSLVGMDPRSTTLQVVSGCAGMSGLVVLVTLIGFLRGGYYPLPSSDPDPDTPEAAVLSFAEFVAERQVIRNQFRLKKDEFKLRTQETLSDWMVDSREERELSQERLEAWERFEDQLEEYKVSLLDVTRTGLSAEVRVQIKVWILVRSGERDFKIDSRESEYTCEVVKVDGEWKIQGWEE